jgi:hypothetical protein
LFFHLFFSTLGPVPAFLKSETMTRADLTARVRRLDDLARGLAKEVTLWKGAHDPLLYLERKAYLGGIQDALAGIEAARVILAKACQRLERDEGPGRTEVGNTQEAHGSAE